MINAKDAREKATSVNNEVVKSELQRIEKLIVDACEKGKTSVQISEFKHQTVKSEIERLGFEIKYFTNQRGGDSYYTIKW